MGAAQWQDMVFSSRAVDFILAFMAAEFAILCWRRRKPPVDLLLALAPGACLVLAVRAAVTGAGWTWIAVFLAASLPFHLADLMRRKL